MLGPNHHSLTVAQQAHTERLDHAARIRLVQRDRHDESAPLWRNGHRALTARRLASSVAAAALTAALVAGTVGSVAASPNNASGGGATLIR